MVSPKQVCVIGAGVSGLAAAKAFAEHGHKVTIIEKSGNLGGVWDPARWRCHCIPSSHSARRRRRAADDT
jgi:cation diffusion facilitator CzcD-associated flavoprotein CzcO